MQLYAGLYFDFLSINITIHISVLELKLLEDPKNMQNYKNPNPKSVIVILGRKPKFTFRLLTVLCSDICFI